MDLLGYILLIGPSVVVLLDTLIAREGARKRKIIGILTALSAAVPVIALKQGGSWLWWALVPVQLGLIYSIWLRGLPMLIVRFAAISIICALAGSAGPGIGSRYFGYSEMLFLPLNVAYWLIPPLIVWYVWRNLPVAWDALRGGSWAQTGVPLTVRHGLLAVVTIILLSTSILFYVQLTELQETARQEAFAAFYGMRQSLDYLENRLTYRDRPELANWQAEALEYMGDYSEEASTLTRLVMKGAGISTDSPLYFIAMGLPKGTVELLERGEPVADADADKLLTVVSSTKQALDAALNSQSVLRTGTYQQVVDQIMQQLQGTDALDVLHLQYQPKWNPTK